MAVTEPTSDNLSDPTQDWPEEGTEAERRDLAGLAARLREARPALPAEAMGRVAEALRRELDRQMAGRGEAGGGGVGRVGGWPRAARWLLPLAAVAGIAAWSYWQHRHHPADRPLAGAVRPTPSTAPASRESAGPAGGADPASVPDRPLLRLDEYRGLFQSEAVGEAAPAADLPRLALPTTRPAALLAAAGPAEAWVRDRPTAARWLGLVELRRLTGAAGGVAGSPPAPADGSDSADLRALLCWRMLPLPAGARGPGAEPALDDFRRQIDALGRADPRHPWLAVFRLYLALREGNRGAGTVRAAAGAFRPTKFIAPGEFPDVPAERAAFDLLRETGVDDVSAGLDVIAGRDFSPLGGLLELDRGLSAAARDDSGSAAAFEAARDGLRSAYLSASTRVVERLFALHRLGQGDDAAKLAARAQALPWLHEPRALRSVLGRLDERQAWSAVVGPLLENEVRMVDAPPELPATRPAGE